jgi:hypothetical protein
MRSALAGTASNVVALKTTATVPMSVIERMFDLLCGVRNQRFAQPTIQIALSSLKLELEIYLAVWEQKLIIRFSRPVYSHLAMLGYCSTESKFRT